MSEGDSSNSRRCWLRLGGHDVEVRLGATLIGRHETCHIVIDDPLASRRHARLRWNGERLMVEDLGSVNGVLHNGKRIEGLTDVDHGDEIKLGNHVMEVFFGAVENRKGVTAKTLVGEILDLPPRSDSEPDELTAVRNGEALTTLALVAERVLAMGRGAEAERLLEKPLNNVRDKVGRSEPVEAETLELAATCAVRLAESTRKGVWLDYVVELHTHLRTVMPGPVVDRMYSAVRAVEVANIERFRLYLELLNEQKHTFGPGELFLLRRVEGLERLLVLK